MSNMSYCRFRNTDRDLSDCQDALEELFNDPAAEPLSREELVAAKRLVERCLEIVSLVADQNGIDLESEDGVADFEAHFAEILDDANEAERAS